MIKLLGLCLLLISQVASTVLSQRQHSSLACNNSQANIFQQPTFTSEQDVQTYEKEQFRIRYLNYLYAVTPDDRKRPSNGKIAGKPLSSCGIPNTGLLGGINTHLCHYYSSDWPEPYPVTFSDMRYVLFASNYRNVASHGQIGPIYPQLTMKDGFPLSSKDYQAPQVIGTITSIPTYYKEVRPQGPDFTANPFIVGFVGGKYGFDSEGYMYQWLEPFWNKTTYDFYDCGIQSKHALESFRYVYSKNYEQEPTPVNCTITGIRSMASAKMEIPKLS